MSNIDGLALLAEDNDKHVQALNEAAVLEGIHAEIPYQGLTPNLQAGGLGAMNYVLNGELPQGGVVWGTGVDIKWQNGAIGENGHNGAFVEDVLVAALTRLECYQDSKFNCVENALAIEGIKAAIAALESRTNKRKERGVEGTHNV